MYDDTVLNHQILNLPIFLLMLILGNPPNFQAIRYGRYYHTVLGTCTRVRTIGGFYFGGVKVNHQTAKFSGYMAYRRHQFLSTLHV